MNARRIVIPPIPWDKCMIREQYLEAYRQLKNRVQWNVISLSQAQDIMARLRPAMKYRWLAS